jgi:hypothetical protein
MEKALKALGPLDPISTTEHLSRYGALAITGGAIGSVTGAGIIPGAMTGAFLHKGISMLLQTEGGRKWVIETAKRQGKPVSAEQLMPVLSYLVGAMGRPPQGETAGEPTGQGMQGGTTVPVQQ